MVTLGEVTGLREPLPCERGQTPKVKHKSPGAAEAQKRSLIERKGAQLKDGDRLAVYRCRHCFYWHVGHNRPPDERQTLPPAIVRPEPDNAARYPFPRSHGRTRRRR